jgi:hypothetical protein
VKFISSLLFSFLVLGCGIIEMLFPIDNFPQRYIEREVDKTELVGTWKITPDSEPRIKTYFEQIQNGDLDWGPVRAPWKTITLNNDGTCKIEFEASWDIENKVLTEPDAGSTCTWKVEKISGYDKELSSKYVPGLFVRFEHFNEQEDQYYVYYSESYIAEENNELVLWNFIGDPIQVEYQDFKKTK